MSIFDMIPYNRVDDFSRFLQEKYGILPDAIPEDFDKERAVSEFLYGNKEESKPEVKKVEQSIDDMLSDMLDKKLSGNNKKISEVVWFEAINKSTGGKIYVVDIVFVDHTSVRSTIKNKENSMKYLSLASRRMGV